MMKQTRRYLLLLMPDEQAPLLLHVSSSSQPPSSILSIIGAQAYLGGCPLAMRLPSRHMVHHASASHPHPVLQLPQTRPSAPMLPVQKCPLSLLVVRDQDALPLLMSMAAENRGGLHRLWAKESSRAISTASIESLELLLYKPGHTTVLWSFSCRL